MPAAGDWAGIWLRTSNGSQIDHLRLEYAGGDAAIGRRAAGRSPPATPRRCSSATTPISSTSRRRCLITNSTFSNNAGNFAIDSVWQGSGLRADPDRDEHLHESRRESAPRARTTSPAAASWPASTSGAASCPESRTRAPEPVDAPAAIASDGSLECIAPDAGRRRWSAAPMVPSSRWHRSDAALLAFVALEGATSRSGCSVCSGRSSRPKARATSCASACSASVAASAPTRPGAEAPSCWRWRPASSHDLDDGPGELSRRPALRRMRRSSTHGWLHSARVEATPAPAAGGAHRRARARRPPRRRQRDRGARWSRPTRSTKARQRAA